MERGATAPLGTLEGTRITAASGQVRLQAGGNLDLAAVENTTRIESRREEWNLNGGNATFAFNHKLRDSRSEERTTLTGTRLEGERVSLAAHHQTRAQDDSHTQKSFLGLVTYGKRSDSHDVSERRALVKPKVPGSN